MLHFDWSYYAFVKLFDAYFIILKKYHYDDILMWYHFVTWKSWKPLIPLHCWKFHKNVYVYLLISYFLIWTQYLQIFFLLLPYIIYSSVQIYCFAMRNAYIQKCFSCSCTIVLLVRNVHLFFFMHVYTKKLAVQSTVFYAHFCALLYWLQMYQQYIFILSTTVHCTVLTGCTTSRCRGYMCRE